jgi:nucleotide-binding universal stress UspA family protein
MRRWKTWPPIAQRHLARAGKARPIRPFITIWNEKNMLKVLLAFDGSDSALRAVDYLINRVATGSGAMQVHLVNVQPSLHGNVSRFVNSEQLRQYHHEEGMAALKPGKEKLEAAGLPCHTHLFVGDAAEAVTRFAREQGCDEIVIGTRGLSGIAGMLMGSVATKVVHLASVPVVLVK